jgi:hypothetical protein
MAYLKERGPLGRFSVRRKKANLVYSDTLGSI